MEALSRKLEQQNSGLPMAKEVFDPSKTRSIQLIQEEWNAVHNGKEQIATTTSAALYALPEGPKSSSRCMIAKFKHTIYEDGSEYEGLVFDAKNKVVDSFSSKWKLPFSTVLYEPDGKRRIRSTSQGREEWREKSDEMGFDKYPEEFPEEIDYEATVTGFMKQIDSDNFDNPVLVLPSEKNILNKNLFI